MCVSVKSTTHIISRSILILFSHLRLVSHVVCHRHTSRSNFWMYFLFLQCECLSRTLHRLSFDRLHDIWRKIQITQLLLLLLFWFRQFFQKPQSVLHTVKGQYSLLYEPDKITDSQALTANCTDSWREIVNSGQHSRNLTCLSFFPNIRGLLNSFFEM